MQSLRELGLLIGVDRRSSFCLIPQVRQGEDRYEGQEGQHERDVELVELHLRASKFSFRTSATPISALSGRGCSASRGRRFPLSQVPLRLLSRMAKDPVWGSRRRRTCSRETSSLV